MHILFFLIALLLLPLTAFGQTVFFKADAESGTVKPPWGNIGTYTSDDYVISSTEQAQAGSRSYKHYVLSPSKQANGAKVSIFPKKTAAYYSSWYYLAQGYDDTQWRNNFQFKTDNSGTTVKGGPKIIMGFEVVNGVRQTNVNIRGCGSVGGPKPAFSGAKDVTAAGSDCTLHQIVPISVPKNKWFHVEMQLIARKTDGVLRVWQDGKLIFDLAHPDFDTLTTWGVDEPAKRSDNDYLYWGIGNYVSPKAVGTQVLYTDNAFVTDYRVSGSVNNPPPTANSPIAPSNLTIVVK